MPSSAGVSAANSQLQQLQQLMNLFLGISQGNTNVSSEVFNQFLQGTGPFASSLLGMNGTESLLAQLAQFRQGLQNPLSGFQMPGQAQGIFDRLNSPLDILGQYIQNGGQTANTMDIRDRLNTIANGLTGPQAGTQALADRMLGSWGMTGSMGSGLESALALLNNGGFNAGLENLANVGGSIVNNRGYGPETQGAMDFFSQIMQNGGRDAGTQNLVSTGQGLINANGMTPEMQQLMSVAMGGIGQGGMTPQLQDLISQGRNLVTSGGMTPQMTAFLQDINNGIASGGMTPEAKQLFEKTMGIVNANGQGGALLPMDKVISMARDAAATRAKNSMEASQRSANSRLGSAVASGLSESVLGGATDQAMQQEADAVRSGALTQQELQLKQLLGAMGVGSDITKSATGLLGSLYNTGGDLFKSASANLGTGAGMMTAGNEGAVRNLASYLGLGGDLTKTAATNINTGADLMGQGEALAAQRMGQGISGFNDTIQNTLARLGLGSQMVTGANTGALGRTSAGLEGVTGINSLASGNQFNAAQLLQGLTGNSLNASQLLSALTGQESGNFFNSIQGTQGLAGLQNSIFGGQQQTALSANAQMIDALMQSMGLSSNISNSFTNNWFGAGNGLTNIGQLYSSLIPSSMGAYGNISDMLIRAQMQPGFWGQLGGNLLSGALGGLTGGLGGLLSSGIGSLFGGGGRNYATSGVRPGFSGNF